MAYVIASNNDIDLPCKSAYMYLIELALVPLLRIHRHCAAVCTAMLQQQHVQNM
jgi:hypothetical protein